MNKAGRIRTLLITVCIAALVVLYIIFVNNNDTGMSPLTHAESSVFLDEYMVNMKRDLFCLLAGYPGFIKDIEFENKNVFVVMDSGRRILYDDREEKDYNGRINNPDLQDMLEQVYPLQVIDKLSEQYFDPGRVRVYAFFEEVYGNSRAEIEKRLAGVPTDAGYFRFNGSNNASMKLKEVFKELLLLCRENPAVYPHIFPISGAYNYRLISGTSRLSPHAFGIAIDMAVSQWDYWKWATREQGQKRISEYPQEAVKVFEKHGFVWGGKWGHFDIMHFEYRPEIILKARYFPDPVKGEEEWYGDIGRFDENMANYIVLIEKMFSLKQIN